MHRRMPLCEMNDVFASQHLPHPLYIPLVSLKDLPAIARTSQQCFVAIGAVHEGGWHFSVSDDAFGRFWLARPVHAWHILVELDHLRVAFQWHTTNTTRRFPLRIQAGWASMRCPVLPASMYNLARSMTASCAPGAVAYPRTSDLFSERCTPCP